MWYQEISRRAKPLGKYLSAGRDPILLDSTGDSTWEDTDQPDLKATDPAESLHFIFEEVGSKEESELVHSHG